MLSFGGRFSPYVFPLMNLLSEEEPGLFPVFSFLSRVVSVGIRPPASFSRFFPPLRLCISSVPYEVNGVSAWTRGPLFCRVRHMDILPSSPFFLFFDTENPPSVILNLPKTLPSAIGYLGFRPFFLLVFFFFSTLTRLVIDVIVLLVKEWTGTCPEF